MLALIRISVLNPLCANNEKFQVDSVQMPERGSLVPDALALPPWVDERESIRISRWRIVL